MSTTAKGQMMATYRIWDTMTPLARKSYGVVVVADGRETSARPRLEGLPFRAIIVTRTVLAMVLCITGLALNRCVRLT